MKLIIMRHGQTAWNVEHRVQGHTDIPLDERGCAQASAIAERLSDMQIDAVYASPLQRAYTTGACIAARSGCPVYKDQRLIERFFGEWEGQRLEDVSRRDPEKWRVWLEEPTKCVVPGGETLDSVLKRSLAFAEEIIEKHRGKNVVIVSHANPVKLLLMHYTGIPVDQMHRIRTDNCSYSELYEREGRFVLNTLNETGFLKERGLL